MPWNCKNIYMWLYQGPTRGNGTPTPKKEGWGWWRGKKLVSPAMVAPMRLPCLRDACAYAREARGEDAESDDGCVYR